MIHQFSYRIGEHDLILETGKMAKQANGAVIASYGGSVVLCTVCYSETEVEGLDFIPLQVEYNEKFYAAGKIPGGFFKREGRPKDKEILVSRLIDRPMRPLFCKDFKREIQIVPTTLSTDQINPPDIIAMVAASACVVISEIPFDGPIGAVRVGSINGKLIINPTYEQIEKGELDMVVAGTKDEITMVEGGGREVSEQHLISAIEKAKPIIAEICDLQLQLKEKAGKEKLSIEKKEEQPLETREKIWSLSYDKMVEACFIKGKEERSKAIKQVKIDTLTALKEEITEEQKKSVDILFDDMEYEIVRKSILEKNLRTDGRTPEQIRPISCEVSVLPRTHGSALFTRGETQALVITTLGTVFDEQVIDDIEGDKRESFMLHYNFPPFSVGETGRLGPGRREIGHGYLAQRSLEAVLPSNETFPYTIRVVSEILESNGSSSMASVCGGSLSLLNAGVPLSKPVAGIAMGLVKEGDKTVILSDILGEEDHLGDMDFKVAGTEDGITGFQMDIKISGVSSEILTRALEQAKEGRLHILKIMNKTISIPEISLSEYAPKIITLQVDSDKIGQIIGPSGKTIKNMSEKYDVEINIEPGGKVTIYGKEREKTLDAERAILSLVEEPEIGKIYTGKVKRITDFGAFVEILSGKEGLVHISKLSRGRVNSVTDVLSLEQEIKVKVIEIDKLGRINLSYIDAIDDGGGERQGRSKTHSRGFSRSYYKNDKGGNFRRRRD